MYTDVTDVVCPGCTNRNCSNCICLLCKGKETEDNKMTRAETLEKAKACVCGQRENEYGSPEDNFTAIAGFWSVYKGVEFTANDVAMMMALLKIARIRTGTATDDSYVDLAGYAACGAEINTNK